MYRWPKKSLTPILAVNYSAPPWVRSKVDMVWMLGLVPTNEKNLQLFLEYVTRDMARYAPGGPGLMLHDPDTDEVRPRYLICLFTNNDVRGFPKGNRQTQAPAIKYPCSSCAISGVRPAACKTTVYPGTGRFLPESSPVKAWCVAHVRGNPFLRREISLPLQRPRPLTDSYVRAAMHAGDCSLVESKKSALHPVKKFGWFGTCCFTKNLPYFRPWMCHLNDPSHCILNCCRDLINIWSNSGNMELTPAKRTLAQSRFRCVTPVVTIGEDEQESTHLPRPPWCGTKEEIRYTPVVVVAAVTARCWQ